MAADLLVGDLVDQEVAQMRDRLAAGAEVLGRGLGMEAADEVGDAAVEALLALDPFGERIAEMRPLFPADPLEAVDDVQAPGMGRVCGHEVAGREVRMVHEEAAD